MFSNTTFNEILKPLNSGLFSSCREISKGDKYTKGFNSWSHLIAMLHCQLYSCDSLRSLCKTYNKHEYNHYHLRTGFLHRSTLSYANNHRNPQLFIELLKRLIPLASGRLLKKETSEMIRILDSSPIQLRGKLLDSCGSPFNGRTNGMKLHIEYDADSQLPTYYAVSPSTVNDVIVGKDTPITPGVTYVFDRAYYNYDWWNKLINHRCRIVTRLTARTAYQVESEMFYECDKGVIADKVIRLSNRKLSHQLRLITVALDPNGPIKRPSNNTNRPPRPKTIDIITNDLLSPAEDIANLYKRRWEVEIFFRWIKQNLKIKRFIGQSHNALLIQILTAIIAYILLKLFQQQHYQSSSISDCILTVRTLLFHRQTTEHTMRKRRKLEIQKYRELQPTLDLGI